MAKARLSQRGRGRRRPSTWEISDSDTEGPTGAEADSEAAASAWDPAGERRAAAEALRRLVVHVDPGAPGVQGEGGGAERSCSSAGAWPLEAPLNH